MREARDGRVAQTLLHSHEGIEVVELAKLKQRLVQRAQQQQQQQQQWWVMRCENVSAHLPACLPAKPPQLPTVQLQKQNKKRKKDSTTLHCIASPDLEEAVDNDLPLLNISHLQHRARDPTGDAIKLPNKRQNVG